MKLMHLLVDCESHLQIWLGKDKLTLQLGQSLRVIIGKISQESNFPKKILLTFIEFCGLLYQISYGQYNYSVFFFFLKRRLNGKGHNFSWSPIPSLTCS